MASLHACMYIGHFQLNGQRITSYSKDGMKVSQGSKSIVVTTPHGHVFMYDGSTKAKVGLPYTYKNNVS